MTRQLALALALAILPALAACGDGVHREEMFEATSGARLALQYLRFDDDTELPTADELYDRELHVRCAPERWADGELRCVPLVDDAVYTDAACTMLAGRARTIEEPALFLAYARIGGAVRPARLFRADAPIEPIAEHYELHDGACTGPFPSPAEPIAYFATGAEFDGAGLVPLRDGEAGGGRLGLRVFEGDDGARLLIGLVDRDLGAACSPARGAAGEVVCAPAGAAPAGYFRDPACREPVAAVAEDAPAPAIAATVEPSGCTGYRAITGELPPGAPIYRFAGAAGAACVATPAPDDSRLYVTGAALALAPIARALEDAPGRRLRRVVLETGGLRFLDDRLFDTATRADCRRRQVGDVPRCLPEATAAARTLFAQGCGVPVPIAEVARPACEPIAFATAFPDGGFEIRALGDRPPGALFQQVSGQCLPYTAPAEVSIHALGPPIDPAAFPGAILFGAR